MHGVNVYLVIGGLLSSAAALLHIAIIIGGGNWYRFFGTGEKFASMADEGSWIPTATTLGITAVLSVWALYAFSGAGLLINLPFLKAALVTITSIYLLRSLEVFYIYFVQPRQLDTFMVWSSLICFGYGVTHAVGTYQVWRTISQD